MSPEMINSFLYEIKIRIAYNIHQRNKTQNWRVWSSFLYLYSLQKLARAIYRNFLSFENFPAEKF